MSYCVCVMKDNPEECKIWVNRGSHMGWNDFNLKSIANNVSTFYSMTEAQEVSEDLSKYGIAATVEERDKILEMIPKNKDGTYIECNCEECKAERK